MYDYCHIVPYAQDRAEIRDFRRIIIHTHTSRTTHIIIIYAGRVATEEIGRKPLEFSAAPDHHVI